MNTHSLTISKIEYTIFPKNKDTDILIAIGSCAEIQNDFLTIYNKNLISFMIPIADIRCMISREV